MDLIVDQMMQLEVVHVADGYAVVELVAGAAVIDDALAVLVNAGSDQSLLDVLERCAVEYRRLDLPAELLRREAEVYLEHLTDVHSGRYAQRVQNDVERTAVLEERHVLLRQDARNDTLVAVAARHLIADRDLALLRDINADDHVDTGRQLVAVLAGKYLNVYNDTRFAVRRTQRGITNLTGLLAEDRAEQALLCGQLGLALRGNLADQNVTGTNLSANADDAALVEVAECVLADVRDITGDLLGSELGITGFGLVLLDMNGGVNVVAYQTLVQQYGVLVVVAFPGHEADEGILAQCNLALIGRRAVGQNVACLDTLAQINDRTHVDTGGLVGTHELGQRIGLVGAVVVVYANLAGGYAGNNAVTLCQRNRTGVNSCLVLHAGCNDRSLGAEQRYGLTLHVRAHQCAVCVVVVEERDECGSNRDHHARRNVHQVNVLAVYLDELVAPTAGYTVVYEVVVLVERLGSLADDVLVLDVRGHVANLVGNVAADLAGLLVLDLFDNAVRRLDKAEVVDAGVGCQIGDQADVRTFRGLDRAQTAVMGVVYVSNLEGCTVTGQTAGTEGGHTALVRQLSQRVVLVHELRKRRGTEELLDGSSYRADVDQGLRRNNVEVLNGHALADNALHAGEADAELVLQQLAYAAQTAVAQMVDIVNRADAVTEVEQIADGSEHIINDDGLRNQIEVTLLHGLLQLVALYAGVDDLLEDGEANLLLETQILCGCAAEVLGEIVYVYHAIAEYLNGSAFSRLDHNAVYAAGSHHGCLLAGENLAVLCQNLAGHRVSDCIYQLVAGDAACDVQLLVVLVAADCGNVVAAHIEEHGIHQRGSRLHRGRLARTHLLVDLDEGFLGGMRRVLVEGCNDQRILTEQLLDLGIGLNADGTDEAGDRNLAVFINANVENVVCIGLVLEPCAAVRDYGSGEQNLVGLVKLLAVVYARGTNELRYDRAFCTVDDEGSSVGHLREVTHEDLLLLDLTGLLVAQTHADLQRSCIRCISCLALLNAVLRLLVHRKIEEGKLQISGVVRDGRGIVKNLTQALIQEPFVRLLLHLDEIRHFENLFDSCKALSCGFAVLYVFHLHVL